MQIAKVPILGWIAIPHIAFFDLGTYGAHPANSNLLGTGWSS